ncbi:MAG TPA: GTP-binding protein, partial [Solirubrobacterales bacterium]|nr:GTP-binding protein [Solirubrobacterales bacterium]
MAQLRNIAIISHVDHGKTTLVDAMLRQAGTFAAHEHLVERVMDSGEQERERGITILAKNASLRLPSPDGEEIKINIVDTPGHADFGGEVERGLSMVDGVLLLVDASEGPLPQTRFVLRKALEQQLPLILVVNKADRPDARPAEVVDAVYDLFLDLDATEDQIEFPIVYASAKEGWATLDLSSPGGDLGPLFSTLAAAIPAPSGDPAAPLQARVTNLDASPYYGRLAVCRVHRGTISRSAEVAWCRRDGSVSRGRIAALYVTEGLQRVEVEEAGAGEIVVVAGMDEVTIGETLAALDEPEALPLLAVDEPALAMTIGVNTSPLAGGSGSKLTGRQLEERLRDELVGNVSIQLRDTEATDAWEVQGRGELQLA